MILTYANFARSQLAGPISNTATTASLGAGTGALFPIPLPGQYFRMVITDQSTGNDHEIVYVTAMSGDTIVRMVRGREGTTGLIWLAGDLVANDPTAGAANAVVQMPAYAGNPNGNVPGTQAADDVAPTAVWDTVNVLDWYCTTSGNEAGAVYQSPVLNYTNSTPVGGDVNKFYGATCAVAQRGTSVSVGAGTNAYTLDGCIGGAVGNTVVFSQSASIGLAPYSLRILGQAGVTDAFVIKPIESLDAFFLANKYTVFQVKCLNNSGASITPTLTVKYANSTDVGNNTSWNASTVVLSAVNLQTVPNAATVTLSATFAMPAGAQNGVTVRLDFGAALNGGGRAVELGDWDIRPSAIAVSTLPVPSFPSYSAELLQCQRYLPGQYAGAFGTTPYFSTGGYFDAANVGGLDVQFFTPTRFPVTGITYSNLTDFKVNYRGTQQSLASLTIDTNNLGPFIGSLDFTTSGLSAVPGEISNLIGQNTNARLIFTGAELHGTAI